MDCRGGRSLVGGRVDSRLDCHRGQTVVRHKESFSSALLGHGLHIITGDHPAPRATLQMRQPLTPSASSSLSPLISSDDDPTANKRTSSQRWQRPCSCSNSPLCLLSFNDPETSTTRPAYLFPLFVIINIATMTDRSIIAGASQEFSAFVSSAQDSPAVVRENPDVGIGLLQGEHALQFHRAVLL